MTDKKDLRLVHFGRAFGLPDASPFCIKPEAYLRLLELDYDLVKGNPMKSPRGQLPVLLHKDEVVAGSEEIIDYLRGLHGSHLDDWLTQEQKAQAYHLLRSVEEYLYFLLLHQRWTLPENFKVVSKNFTSDFPPLLGKLLAYVVKRGSRKRTEAQGVGRYSPEEVDERCYLAMEMLAATLGDKDYFFGDKPCWVDCSVYGFVANLMVPQFKQGACLRVKEFDNLVAYEERFRAKVFPDLPGPGGEA